MVITQDKYHIALDGVGMILQGTPDQPVYRVEPAPIYTSRFAQGDRTYDDFSKWWYWIQTDWSQGLQNDPSWQDNGKYYYSQNIDSWSFPGSFQLCRQPEAYDEAADTVHLFNVGIAGGFDRGYFGGDDGLLSDTLLSIETGTNDDVTLIEFFQDYAWIGHWNLNPADHTVRVYDDSTWTDVGGYIDDALAWPGSGIRHCSAGVVVGDRIYLGVMTNDQHGIVSCAKGLPTASGDFTVHLNSDAEMDFLGMKHVAGKIVYLVENGGIGWIGVYDIAADANSTLLSFKDIDGFGFRNASRALFETTDGVLIAITYNTSDGDIGGELWLYNGSSLTRLYKSDDRRKALFGAQGVGYFEHGGAQKGNQVMFPGITVVDGVVHNWIQDLSDADYDLVPIGVNESGDIYFVDQDTDTDVKVIEGDGTTAYKSTAGENYIVFNQFDKVSGIEKLAYSVTMIFDKFDVGEKITVEYNIDDISVEGDWQELGFASYTQDGADVTEKTLYFPENTIFKKMWIRIKLDGDGTSTPVYHDYIMAYVPIPPQDKRWILSVDCGDYINLLNGQRQDQNGREIRGNLEQSWLTNRIVDFQDVDFAMCNLTSAVSVGDVTISVDDTSEFPETGRIRIEDEIIYYTGKTQKTFTGCTRGEKDTEDSAHSITQSGTGTISSTGSSVTGSGTAFTTELQVGDMITADSQEFQVIEIISDTSLKINGAPTSPWSADAFTINPSVHNAYKVLVEAVGTRIPILNRDKAIEYVATITLREVI